MLQTSKKYIRHLLCVYQVDDNKTFLLNVELGKKITDHKKFK